jgi:hypothetical protein
VFWLPIFAQIQPVDVSAENEPLYRQLEIHMQRLGHLIPFREQLNWTTQFENIELGDAESLQLLKKAAAKNDGVLLFYAKLTKGTVFQHIILHPNDQGIYLPFQFDDPFYLKFNEKKFWIGSAVRLKEELKWLEITMQNQPDNVVHYWDQLRKSCQSSIQHNSPIVLKKEKKNH